MTTTDQLSGTYPPPAPTSPPPPPAPQAEHATQPASPAEGGWKDRLKQAADTAVSSGKQVAGQARRPWPSRPASGRRPGPRTPTAPATAAAAAAPPVDVADQLRKLAALRDEGILTPEEFEAQKARLLGG